MSDNVVINDQMFSCVRTAARSSSYSPDYVARLAREQKIKAVRLGRRWYVRPDSLQSYILSQRYEQDVRQKMLREQRVRELQQKEIANTAEEKRVSVKIEWYSFLFVSCVIGTGSLIGATFLSPVVDQVRSGQVATAISPASKPGTTDTAFSDLVVTPVFTNSNHAVQVSSERSIEHPAHRANGWQYTYHE